MNMCTGVRKKEKKFSAWEWVCQIFSPRDTRFPHLDTHSQLPDLFLPPGFCSGYTSSSAEKKGGSCRRRMCLFIESGSAWKVSNRQQPPQTQRKGSPLSPGWSGQRWTQGLEFGYRDEQAEETNKVPQREEYFFFPPHELYRNAFSVGPSIRPKSITTFRRVHHTFALRESQLTWVQDREGSYRPLANMERQTI